MNYYPAMNNYVASLAKISKTGNTRYFNVFEEWNDSYAEIWEKFDGKRVMVFNAGRTNTKIGKTEDFYSDATNRRLFSARLVEVLSMEELKGNITPMAAYTYK